MDHLTCAITGHRPEKFYFKEDSSDCKELKEEMKLTFESLYNSGYDQFIVGGARGVDMWASEILLDLRKRFGHLELYCLLPFKSYTAKWNLEDIERQRNILLQSNGRKILAESYSPDCYKRRNYEMVDRSQLLLAVCDRDNPNSGSMQTVQYARKKHMETIFIDPYTFEFSMARNAYY